MPTAASSRRRPAPGHGLLENRHGLVAQEHLCHATGRAEREAALVPIDRQPGGTTSGAGRGHDPQACVEAPSARGMASHIARDVLANRPHHSAAPDALTRTEVYRSHQRIRTRIKEVSGRIRQSAGLRQARHREIRQVSAVSSPAVTACNPGRPPKLPGQPARTVAMPSDGTSPAPGQTQTGFSPPHQTRQPAQRRAFCSSML